MALSTLSTILLACLVMAGVQAQSVYSGGSYQGLATYYGASGDNGHCSYQNSNAGAMPWAQGVIFVAINSGQYQNSATCGMCLAMTATGSGAGGNPLPSQTQVAMVVNECPTCQDVAGIDMALDGDGAWGITWTPIPCPGVGDSPFQYACENCHPYFNKILISNHRMPLASVTLNGVPLARSPDNHWITGAAAYPATLAITSVMGQTVTDTLQAWSGPNGVQTGGAQFPAGSFGGRKLMGI